MTDAGSPRWRGQSGRLEVWYATATDTATGTGLWLHHELVSPTDADAYAHGWLAAFPVAAPPAVVRFGPHPVEDADPEWLTGSGFSVGPSVLTGAVADAAWDLRWESSEPPLWTMGETTWRREILPSAQVVIGPKARFRGPLRISGLDLTVDAIGNLAHIYGHGNAQRWGWLHADLDDSTTLEIVAAVGRRPALRRLPPLAFVQLRRHGEDWPHSPIAAAALFRTRLGELSWSVRGVVGTHRLTVTVTQHPEHSVYLDYTDPDGAGTLCVNTEVADADVRLEKWSGRWNVVQEWSVRSCAHSELGSRAGGR